MFKYILLSCPIILLCAVLYFKNTVSKDQPIKAVAAVQQAAKQSKPEAVPAPEIKREVYRGVTGGVSEQVLAQGLTQVHREALALRTDRAYYVEGEISDLGLVVSIRVPDRRKPYAIVKAQNGSTVVYVVADAAGAVVAPVAAIK